ncbi:hypothetical protein [Modestobacter sp. Leaf380]|uniref:hypothetical protein n=1 Tax=Modestobacter sp. Leaf380 TaxID=1736356 RepID=UPI0006FF86E1|nr:hypothetical protein [Modestobacter sp. Leaf380]KQS68416.1 hypothetical protein ASG41_05345 [Modestobacter sp. Leaf380]
MTTAGLLVTAAQEQLPEDVGKSGPFGLLLVLLLLVAILLLGRSMGKHLKRLPRSFDAQDAPVVVPDDASELFEQRRPGEDLLDTLRQAPLAIEAPRADPDEGSATTR